jgi:hypothetical protein
MRGFARAGSVLARANRVKRVAAIAIGIATTTAAPTAARAASRVVLVEAPDASLRDATSRLRGELAAAGFEVSEVSAQAADDAGSFATVRLQRTASGAIEVWVSDQLTAKTVVRRIGNRPRDRAPRVIAIRALELLRASLLEIESPPPPPPDDVPAAPPPPPVPADVVAWVRAESPAPPALSERASAGTTNAKVPVVEHVAVGAGAALLASFDGLGPVVLPAVDLWIALNASLAMRVTLAGPGFRGGLENAAGTALVRQELAKIELVWLPAVGPTWLAPMVSVGAGPYHLHVRGTATPPFRPASDDVWAALLDAGVGLAGRMSPRAAIVIDAHAVVTTPRAAVAIGDAQVASAGAPSLFTSLQLVASF